MEKLGKKVFIIVALLVLFIALSILAVNKKYGKHDSASSLSGGNNVASTTSSLNAETSTSSWFIVYRRKNALASPTNGKSFDEFVLYNMITKEKKVVDFNIPEPFVLNDGRTPVIYTRSVLDDKKNIYEVDAYDFSKRYRSTIDVTDTDVSLSGFVASPHSPEIGYCSEDKEGVYYLEDLTTGNKKVLTQFSGCPSDKSQFNPPEYSADGAYIYYQNFGDSLSETGEYVNDYSFERIDPKKDISQKASLLGVEKGVSFTASRLAGIATCPVDGMRDVDAYNNCIFFYDISDIADLGVLKGKLDISKRVFSKIFSGYQHVGRVITSIDGEVFYSYTYLKKGNDTNSTGYQIQAIDPKTEAMKVLDLPDNVEVTSLVKGVNAYLIFIGNEKGSSIFNLYSADVQRGTIEKIETNVGLESRVAGDVFFLKQK